MLIDLAELGLISISGIQSAEFLQGQFSCDIKEVTASQSRLGLHCNPKGRVLASFRLFYVDPKYYVLLPQSMVELLIRDLKKYAIFYKIELQATTAFSYKIGISGDDMTQTLASYGCKIPLQDNAVYPDHADSILFNIPSSPSRAILLSQKPIALSSDKKAFDYWQQLEIESGLASIYPNVRALFTPHQLYYHQHQGISFTKGCYTGQEVIARMHYLGQLKNKLYSVTIPHEHAPQAGHDILDAEGQKQGVLVMTTATPINHQKRYQGLASIHNTAIGKMLYLDQAPVCIVQAV